MTRRQRTHVVYLSPEQLADLDTAIARDDTKRVAELDTIAQRRKVTHEAKMRSKRRTIFGIAAVIVVAVIGLLIVHPWTPKRVGPCIDNQVDPALSVEVDKMAVNATGWIVPWDLERDDLGNYHLKPIAEASQGIEGEGHFCLRRTATSFEVWGDPKEIKDEVHGDTAWVVVTLHP